MAEQIAKIPLEMRNVIRQKSQIKFGTKPHKAHTRYSPRDKSEKSYQSRRIVLIDETALTRDCLEHILICYGSGMTVGAVSKISDASIDHPDIVILNTKSAKVTDAAVVSQLAAATHRFAGVPIAVLTDHDDSSLAAEAAMKYNLRGYIPTSLSARVVVAAVHLIMVGGTFFPAQSAVKVQTSVRKEIVAGSDADAVSADNHGLTQREAEILNLLRQGKPNKIIAYDLQISENTVKVHMRHILTKLHTNNRTQAALHTPAWSGSNSCDPLDKNDLTSAPP